VIHEGLKDPLQLQAQDQVLATVEAGSCQRGLELSSAAGVQNSVTAGADGVVSWSYNTTSNTTPGTGTNTVTCASGGQTATDSASFSVP